MSVSPKIIRDYEYIRPHVFYSSIVRKDQFRPDSESKRDLDAGGTPSFTGQYDGTVKDVKTDTVPPELIMLRENRFDKAEIEQVKESLKKRAQSEQDTAEAEATAKAADDALKARSDAVDKLLGVSKS